MLDGEKKLTVYLGEKSTEYVQVRGIDIHSEIAMAIRLAKEYM